MNSCDMHTYTRNPKHMKSNKTVRQMSTNHPLAAPHSSFSPPSSLPPSTSLPPPPYSPLNTLASRRARVSRPSSFVPSTFSPKKKRKPITSRFGDHLANLLTPPSTSTVTPLRLKRSLTSTFTIPQSFPPVSAATRYPTLPLDNQPTSIIGLETITETLKKQTSYGSHGPGLPGCLTASSKLIGERRWLWCFVSFYSLTEPVPPNHFVCVVLILLATRKEAASTGQRRAYPFSHTRPK